MRYSNLSHLRAPNSYLVSAAVTTCHHHKNSHYATCDHTHSHYVGGHALTGTRHSARRSSTDARNIRNIRSNIRYNKQWSHMYSTDQVALDSDSKFASFVKSRFVRHHLKHPSTTADTTCSTHQQPSTASTTSTALNSSTHQQPSTAAPINRHPQPEQPPTGALINSHQPLLCRSQGAAAQVLCKEVVERVGSMA